MGIGGAVTGTTPTVVIVGRPNVGKSTLFNRMVGARRSLVHGKPGVTRDRIVAVARHPDHGEVLLVDTGGIVVSGGRGKSEVLLKEVKDAAEAAISNADLVLLVVDGSVPPTPDDLDLGRWLSGFQCPKILVLNKSDRSDFEWARHEYHRLGIHAHVAVSAEHGRGVEELWAEIAAMVRPTTPAKEEEKKEEWGEAGAPEVVIAGRPNVGKSSLLNAIVGAPRAIVSEIPGTTRDTVDVMVEIAGGSLRFIDTAGIRRKGKTERGPEVLSVVMARKALTRAKVAILVVDATEGITAQDAHVAGYAWQEGCALVVAANKWDLVSNKGDVIKRLGDQMQLSLRFAKGAPLVPVSALTGKGVSKLLRTVLELARKAGTRVGTAQLNRVLGKEWEHSPPPRPDGKESKLYYAVQVGVYPPSFALFTNLRTELHFSQLRRFERVIREAFGFQGIPVRVKIKGRKG